VDTSQPANVTTGINGWIGTRTGSGAFSSSSSSTATPAHSHTEATSHPTSYIHLVEPMLPVRYYLPPTAVDPSILRPSSTRSLCPYKGEAEYYDIVLREEGEKEVVYRDLVWWYRYPTVECGAIAGMLCFYNEKVDVWLDGEECGRPKTKFA
jgi:uncharacterized protein (DUF427 family)